MQTEEDNMRRAAEQKKTEKRRVIAKMREELKQLMDENAAQPAERRIDASEFNIDKEYSALLEKKGQELCEVSRRSGLPPVVGCLPVHDPNFNPVVRHGSDLLTSLSAKHLS